MTDFGRRRIRTSRRLWAASPCCARSRWPAAATWAGFQTGSPSLGGNPAKPNRTVAQTPAAEREHERILSSYGGSYDDPRLEALIGKTVDRLVAASDRPDQAYKVTILNSGAVNAFALPTGQLYVTRGLIALASDTSELSSVLSHEMAHVLAKHASIREDQARQAAVVTRVVTDMGNDPDLTALALAKTKLTMASFSRAQEFEADGIGVGISARAKFDPYGASRFLTSMERNAALKAGKSSLDPRAQDFLSSHPATPERVQNAQNSARQFTSPEGGERDRETYLAVDRQHRLWRGPQRRFRARPAFPASEARLHLCRARHLHAGQHRAGGDRRARGRHAGDALRRGAGAGGADADRLSQFRLDGECREGLRRGNDHQRVSRRHPPPRAATSGSSRSMRCASAATSIASSSPSKQKTTESDRNARETVNSFRRLTLEEIQAARPLRIKVITVQPGDTVESLSHRMSGVDRPAERFRILNGLDAHAQVKARDRVKIVVD